MDPRTPPKLSLAQRVDVRLRATLLARLQTVQLLKMAEPEIAELIRQVESDPLFSRMLYPGEPGWKILRFQPHPRTILSPSFYEMKEDTLPSGASAEAATVMSDRRDVLDIIRRVGQANFEKYFLKAETEMAKPEMAKTLGVSEAEVQKIRDFLLAYSVQAEFFDPSARQEGRPGERVVRLARLSLDANGEPVFEFRSPLLARGRYDIQYDRLQSLLQTTDLTPQQRRHMRAFVRRLELINWRQNTLYRILDFLCHSQRHFLASRDALKKVALTQRQLAKRLAVAPSTINRAIQGRSLVMPWGQEVLLEEIFCSRKALCVDALGALEADDVQFDRRTDMEIQRLLQDRLGFPVPRRTVNSYRRVLASQNGQASPHAA